MTRPTDDELAGWLRLTLTEGVGSGEVRALLAAFGLPPAIFDASRAQLARIVPDHVTGRLVAAPDDAIREAIDRTRTWLDADSRHALVTFADPAYPPALLEIGDPPPVLYCRGRLELLGRSTLAMVGSRNATRQGEENAARFAAYLASAGWTIASGLALGIDAAAHRGALDAAAAGASTVAIVGTGVDRAYPAANRELAQRIAADGLVLSEYALGAPPRAWHFPRRNRLIAALSRGVLVVEAALQSGSLITARQAAEYGREVFAIPGSIHAPLARGCHRLIKDGAKLVESADDILAELAPGTAAPAQPATSPSPPRAPDPLLSQPRRELLAALGDEPADIDALCERTGQGAAAVTAGLFELEMTQHVERLPGNRYQRLR